MFLQRYIVNVNTAFHLKQRVILDVTLINDGINSHKDDDQATLSNQLLPVAVPQRTKFR